MNEIQIFNFEDSEIRTRIVNNEPWFFGKDVADILGYSNTRDALNRHVDLEDKSSVVIHDGTSGNPLQTIINESGLYSLILKSKLSSAKKFKRWVTSEVLPIIRKTGSYQIPMSKEDIMIATLETQKELKVSLKLVQADVADLKQEINLSRSQKHHLAGLVRKNVYNALGGKRAQAYSDRNLRARLYSQHWREIKNYFDVEAYEEIPKVKFGEAVQFTEMWEPSTELKMLIVDKNSQIPLEI